MGLSKAEVVSKIRDYVDNRFDKNYKEAFSHYDRFNISDGKVDQKGLIRLLKDARVGSWLTQGTIAKKIIETIDKDADGKISWDEFKRKIMPAGQF